LAVWSKKRRISGIVFNVEIIGPLLSNQRSLGHVTADQNTSWHTTLRTPNATIISHLPELSQNHAVAPEPSIRLTTLSAKMRKHSIAASW